MTPGRKRFSGRMKKMPQAMKAADKQPAIGVTQGGSSRTRGAKPAATGGPKRPREGESR